MSNYTRWADVREEMIARAGGEEVVEALANKMLAEVHAYRLAETRKKRHISQRELAEALGMTAGQVRQIEHGDLDISGLSTIARYVAGLGGRLRVIAEFDDDVMQIA